MFPRHVLIMFVLHYVSLFTTRNHDVPVEETATGSLCPLIKDISELHICNQVEVASLPSNSKANFDATFGTLADYIGKFVVKPPARGDSGSKSDSEADSDSTHSSMPGLVADFDSSDDSEGESEEVTGRYVILLVHILSFIF
jgi:hypothetical protein